MYIRSALVAVALSFTATATPASAHYSGCSGLQNYWSGGFCKQAHYIRHHSAQARNQSPWAAPVGSYTNPYRQYWSGVASPVVYPGYPSYPAGYPYPSVGTCGGVWQTPVVKPCPYYGGY